ncbi:MAG: deoxyribose-phosphate aldolase [Thermacetogeniaceae bacterium]|jgi:deoxyribose-phosphate aldolase
MKDELAKCIEHTLLRPDAVEADYVRLCQEAVEYGFYGVCVPPSRIGLAREHLADSDVRVVTVAGFPLGYQSSAAKVFEVEKALTEGAHEIDMVINIGLLKEGKWKAVEQEIRGVVGVCAGSLVVKVIIETCYLNDQEKIRAAQLVQAAGADFIKTSTGFGPQGATVHDVELIRRTVGDKLLIKAAGGIKTRESALSLLRAGAARLGTSRGPALINDN